MGGWGQWGEGGGKGKGAAAGEGGGEGPWVQGGKGRARRMGQGWSGAKERRPGACKYICDAPPPLNTHAHVYMYIYMRDDARFLMPFRGLVGVLLWEVMKKRRKRGRCLPHCNLPP
jgi:hypothetical protein